MRTMCRCNAPVAAIRTGTPTFTTIIGGSRLSASLHALLVVIFLDAGQQRCMRHPALWVPDFWLAALRGIWGEFAPQINVYLTPVELDIEPLSCPSMPRSAFSHTCPRTCSAVKYVVITRLVSWQNNKGIRQGDAPLMSDGW